MVGHPHNAVHSRSDFVVYLIQEFALGLAGGLAVSFAAAISSSCSIPR